MLETQTELLDLQRVSEITSDHHEKLMEMYEGIDPETVETNPDAPSLMSYNGYYSLDTTSGAFFSIDTNMVIVNGSSTPIYHVSLIVSLDGKNSQIYSFTKGSGSFDGTNLKFNEQGIVLTLPIIDLIFTRGDSDDLITATLHGSIQMPHKEKTIVSGNTYNNIIPMSTYNGAYYENTKNVLSTDVIMEISDNYTLKYRSIDKGAELKQVKNYVYNMNMYFFSFTSDSNSVKVIMGTSSDAGKVCNNLIETTGKDAKLYSRSLQTVTKMNKTKGGTPVDGSTALAQFSGFYEISSSVAGSPVKGGAFISIEGLYDTLDLTGTPSYSVILGISMNGTDCYTTLINSNMSFVGNTLTVTDFHGYSIEINFKRKYRQESNNEFGSLVSITGKINGDTISGSTAFNPVPLTAFRGMTLTTGNSISESLEIISDTELKYNGTQYQVITYVPLMYIAVFILQDGTKVVLSLGTDGGKGTSCIVRNPKMTQPTTAVYGIPDGKSGQ